MNDSVRWGRTRRIQVQDLSKTLTRTQKPTLTEQETTCVSTEAELSFETRSSLKKT